MKKYTARLLIGCSLLVPAFPAAAQWEARLLTDDTNANSTSQIAVADFDLDGDLDLALADGSSVLMMQNDGAGVFTLASTVSTAASVVFLSAGDADGDADQDLLIGGASYVSWIPNGGTGLDSFGDEVVVDASRDEQARAPKLADLDGDGDADIVTAYFGARELVYYRNDAGSFVEGGSVAANGVRDLEVGDFDLDGDPDVFVGLGPGRSVQYLENTSSGGTIRLEAATTALRLLGDTHVEFDLVDLDGDRRLDVLSGTNSSRFGYALARSEGFASGVTLGDYEASGLSSVGAIDIDADGLAEIVARSNTADQPIRLFKNVGSGFVEVAQMEASSPSGLDFVAADIDGDGDQDLIVGGSSAGVRVFRNPHFDADGDGYVAGDDCNDMDASIHPGALERCNEIDDDCDGVLPRGEYDADEDGVIQCVGDCDDLRADVSPLLPELCDGRDNNCNGAIDDGMTDTDSDGACDLIDLCPADAADDSDMDGSCDSEDLCTGDDRTADIDGDGICNDMDTCVLDDADDSDDDGVCDSADVCPGEDDRIDADGDGRPDACDMCPSDAGDDSDLDGSCDSADVCNGFDDRADLDGDSVPDGCDACPIDADDDSDSDGVCDSVDSCTGDDSSGDSDSDGVCDDADACLGDDASGDADTDGECATDIAGAVVDCDDSNAERRSGAEEVCGDSIDNNCDGTIDEGCVVESGGCAVQPARKGGYPFALLLAGLAIGALVRRRQR